MRKKIVVKVNIHCPNWRTKALQIASQLDGVEYVGYQREKEDDEDEVLAVIGDSVDAVKLVKQIRKKVGWVKLLAVEDHKN